MVTLPTISPLLAGRRLWVGYFKCISDRYGDNIYAPGNCTVCETEAECLRSKQPYFAPIGVGDTARKIASFVECNQFNPLPEYVPPGTLCIWDGGSSLPPTPQGSLTGIEVYSDPGESFESCELRIRKWLKEWPLSKIILIGQGYTRNGTETNLQKLADLQALPFNLASEFPSIKGVLIFSDGRPTGTRDNEWWRSVHYNAATLVVPPTYVEDVMQPYNEDKVKQYCEEVVRPTYREAGREPDDLYPVWPARTVYDYCGGMSWDASCKKHTRELREALGLPIPFPPTIVLPRLVVNGQGFKKETGELFTAIECSDFNLFNRYQNGEDCHPIWEQRSSVGFNMQRVWTLYNLQNANIGVLLNPNYDLMAAFCRDAARYGIYIEFTAYTSLEIEEHWQKLQDAIREESNALLELVNEGTLAVNQIDMSKYARPVGIISSHGSGGGEGVPPWEPWDYVTYHTNGASEEQRKIGHNAMEKPAVILGWHGPTLTNETSRYPEVGMWVGGDLNRQKNLAFDSAAGAALLCMGSCFHSVHGKSSELWDANELEVAKAWVAGAKSVPLAAQNQPYTRRDDLLTPELLRVYQRGSSDDHIVRIRK